MISDADEVRVPLVEERVQVEKVEVETDRVRVRTVVDEHSEIIEQVLQTGRLDVRHIPLDQEVAEAPAPRQDGDTLIVSIVEERLVKRLFLVEEVHITQSSHAEAVRVPVSLRRMRAVVEQDAADPLPTGRE
jgi:stress response protein YsnF